MAAPTSEELYIELLKIWHTTTSDQKTKAFSLFSELIELPEFNKGIKHEGLLVPCEESGEQVNYSGMEYQSEGFCMKITKLNGHKVVYQDVFKHGDFSDEPIAVRPVVICCLVTFNYQINNPFMSSIRLIAHSFYMTEMAVDALLTCFENVLK